MDETELIGYFPGAIGRVTELQATYYHTHWNMGLYFEARAATELSAFLSRFDPARDGAWIARVKDEVVGAIFIDGIDGDGEGARLRWFIIAPAYQGHGLGNRLMGEAVGFCKKAGYRRVYLTTFSGLNAARHLYEKFGFRLYHEADGSHLTGNSSLTEQKFVLTLSDDHDRSQS
jgi:RimJ/RimL family protein N-acetyltransferase